MMPYICEGTIVRFVNSGKQGHVLGVDRQNKLAAVVDTSNCVCSEKIENLEVVSYKGVQ